MSLDSFLTQVADYDDHLQIFDKESIAYTNDFFFLMCQYILFITFLGGLFFFKYGLWWFKFV